MPLLRSVVVLLLVLVPLAAGECQGYVEPRARVDCGWPGIPQEKCESFTDCCFDNSVLDVIWCYYSKAAKCANIFASERVDCEKPSNGARECKDNGCCFDDGYCFSKSPADPLNPCSGQPCKNEGVCKLDGEDDFKCKCKGGHKGKTCNDNEVCSKKPCENKGKCKPVGKDDFKCDCKDGHKGKTCNDASEVDPCASEPCQNEGRCHPTGHGDYQCDCKGAYKGKTCNGD